MKPMQLTATVAALVALALAGWATTARAAPPLVTADAPVMNAGECQWHYSRDNGKAGNLKARGWTTQAGCGVGANTQLEAGFVRAKGADERMDAVYVTGKTQTVRASEPGGTDVSVGYSWAGDRERGTSTRSNSLALQLIVSKELLPRFTGHMNLGWLKVKGLESTLTWGVAGEYRVTDRFDVAAETFGEDGSRPWMAVGVRYALWEKARVFASHGIQRDEPRLTLTSAGIQLDF
jgi:hypothetical protein